jgi:hypothetical protein
MTGIAPANMVFARELRLPYLFGARPDKDESTTDYAANFAERLHDIDHFTRQQLKMSSDRMKARYDRLASSAGFQEGNQVWLYRPTRKREKSLKLQSSWKGP